VPFAANPLAGLFYLPGWIAMLFPLPFGILLVSAGHSVFGAWGMFRFLERMGVERRSSLVGGLCFGMMPKLAAHLGAGHISLLYALAWTPWLFAAYMEDQKGWRTGAAAGMLFFADPRWAVYAGLLFVPYTIVYRHYKTNNIGRLLLFYLKASGTALLIGAPLILPLLEYLPLATRSSLEVKDIFLFGLPNYQLLGLIMPVSSGNVEWFLYPGGIVLTILTVQLFIPDQNNKTRFWNYALVLSLIMSMAFLGKVISWIQYLPVLSLLRVPSRALFLVGFCASIICGFTLEFLKKMDSKDERVQRIGIITLTFYGMMAMGIMVVTGKVYLQMIWGFGFLALGSFLVMIAPGRISGNALFLGLSVLILVDLIGTGWMAYQVRTNYHRVDRDVLEILVRDKTDFRVYTPSYSIGQGEAVASNLELANGVDPMQISSFRSFMERASGVPIYGYSVSIPGIPAGYTEQDFSKYKPNSELLGILNVKYLVSEFPIQDPEFIPIEVNSTQYLYRNQKYLPRAWIERDETVSEIIPAQIIKNTPNIIEVRANGPGKLVLSEVYYPGWRVMIDGKKAEITRAHQILRSVSISEGSHLVKFNYRPLSVISGLVLAGIGWVIIISSSIGKKR